MRIAVVPGDGIGVDVTREAVKVLERVAGRRGIPLELTTFPWSADHYLKTGETVPEGAFDALSRGFDAIFMGAFGDPRVPDMRHAADILLGARFQLDLYVNYRPVRCLDDRLCPLKGFAAADVDFVVFRENTEGAYVGSGGNFKKGTADEVAVQEDISTRKGVERILRFAFEYARGRPRKRLVMSDKSNAMRFVGDLWQRVFAEVSRDFPDVEASHLYIDALCMQMVRDPRQFDVVVTNNMFGDIATDLGAALQGGLGMAASGNLHPGRISMFEPVHGSAPKYAGTGKANPFGAILTAALLLEHLGRTAEAAAVEAAVRESIARGRPPATWAGAFRRRRPGIPSVMRCGFEAGPAVLKSGIKLRRPRMARYAARLFAIALTAFFTLSVAASLASDKGFLGSDDAKERDEPQKFLPDYDKLVKGKDADWVYFPTGKGIDGYKTVMVKEFDYNGHGHECREAARDGQDYMEKWLEKGGFKIVKSGAEVVIEGNVFNAWEPSGGALLGRVGSQSGRRAGGPGQGREGQRPRRDPPEVEGLHTAGRGRKRARGRRQVPRKGALRVDSKRDRLDVLTDS